MLDNGSARDQWSLQARIPIPSIRQRQYSQGTLPSLGKLLKITLKTTYYVASSCANLRSALSGFARHVG